MNNKFSPGDRVVVDAGLGITKTGNVQRLTESTVFVKHFNGAVVGYKTQHVTKVLNEQAAPQPRGVGLKSEFEAFMQVMEKTLTPAELKKREEVAKAIERENPDMPMDKKMAIATATAKKVAEDTEQIDELSQDTLKSYASKVAMDAMKHEKDPTKRSAEKRSNSVSGFSKALNRLPAQKFFNKEDMHYCAKHVFSERFGEGLVVEGSHAEPNEQGLIEWYDVDFGGQIRRVMTEKVKVMHAEYHMNHKKKMKEEEEVEEAASHQASTTMKHVKGATAGEKKAAKDIKPGIAGYRDRIAMLKSAESDGRLKEGKTHTVPKTAKEKDLAALADPKDKITHADVMVGRGVKKEEMSSKEKMKRGLYNKEEAEQIDELNKDTLTSYQDKADADITRKHRVLGPQIKAGDAKAANKTADTIGKRMAGIDRAVTRLNKEGVDLDEAMISYSDFQSKINAHKKAGNQIKDDKYDSKKASYTVIDQEGTAKKITHTDSGVSQQHLGNVKRDDDESSETKSTEKRGRGRPAGSKSGARN